MRASLLILLLSLVSFACRKADDEPKTGCDATAQTLRHINNKFATVEVNATIIGVLLVEDNTIDSKLVPCNLPQEYVQHGLKVIISGDVKARKALTNEPCCKDAFVISKIARR